MAIFVVVDDADEPRAAAVARRVREECAGQRIKYSELARMIGKSPQAISRRISGEIPWDVDELDRACRATGMSYHYITAGTRPLPADLELLSLAGIRLASDTGRRYTREQSMADLGLTEADLATTSGDEVEIR